MDGSINTEAIIRVKFICFLVLQAYARLRLEYNTGITKHKTGKTNNFCYVISFTKKNIKAKSVQFSSRFEKSLCLCLSQCGNGTVI